MQRVEGMFLNLLWTLKSNLADVGEIGQRQENQPPPPQQIEPWVSHTAKKPQSDACIYETGIVTLSCHTDCLVSDG